MLGKLSGRAGFVSRIRELGFDLTDDALTKAFERFQALADDQPVVGDAELREICAAV